MTSLAFLLPALPLPHVVVVVVVVVFLLFLSSSVLSRATLGFQFPGMRWARDEEVGFQHCINGPCAA